MDKYFFTQEPTTFLQFKDKLAQDSHIIITFHQNPDGDALGSALGLKFFLENYGIQRVTLISPTPIAEYLLWMPGASEILIWGSQAAHSKIKKGELIFCLDFSALSRLKDMADEVAASKAPIVVIDHHEQPEDFATFLYWDVMASSTCELIFRFIKDLDKSELIDQKAATCLYTGILTDTGLFKYSSTTPAVHLIAADLLIRGVNPTEVNRLLFDVNPFQKIKFLGFALGEKLTFLPEYRTAYMAISADELSRFESRNGDTEGLVNYGLTIENSVMSVLFTEKENQIRISFRSVHNFSVAEIARKYFEGGGHRNAAGGRSNLSLQETVEKFLNLLPQFKNELLKQPK